MPLRKVIGQASEPDLSRSRLGCELNNRKTKEKKFAWPKDSSAPSVSRLVVFFAFTCSPGLHRGFPPGLEVEEGRKYGIFSFPREFLRKKEEEFLPFFLPFLHSSLLSSQMG